MGSQCRVRSDHVNHPSRAVSRARRAEGTFPIHGDWECDQRPLGKPVWFPLNLRIASPTREVPLRYMFIHVCRLDRHDFGSRCPELHPKPGGLWWLFSPHRRHKPTRMTTCLPPEPQLARRLRCHHPPRLGAQMQGPFCRSQRVVRLLPDVEIRKSETGCQEEDQISREVKAEMMTSQMQQAGR